MSDLPNIDPDFPDSGRCERDSGGDMTWVVVAAVVLVLLMLAGSGRL